MAFQPVWGSFSPSSRTALSLEDLADLSDLPHPILEKQRGDLIGSNWEVPSPTPLQPLNWVWSAGPMRFRHTAPQPELPHKLNLKPLCQLISVCV